MPPKESTCTSARGPTSLSCEGVFSNIQTSPLTTQSQLVIERVPDYFESLKQIHGFDYKSLNDYTLDLRSSQTTYLIAESLYNDYIAGSPAGPKLLDLGYHIDQVPSPITGKMINVLRPNLNLSELYQKIYSQLLPKNSDQTRIEDLIIPALLFARLNPESGKQEITMSRPGFDPIPDPSKGWKLKQQAQLDLPTFALYLSQGKIPLEYSMYHHDIAHSLDYISSPHLVKWYKAYHKALYERSQLYGVKSELGLASQYLHEFLMFPKLKMRTTLRALIHNQKTAQSPAKNRLAELREQFDSGELSRRIETLQSHFFQLFEVHGGGILDGISHHRFADTPTLVINQIQQGYLSISMPTVQAHVGRDSFWGLVQQMALMNEVISSNKNKSDAAEFVGKNIEGYEAKIPSLLIELMEKFENKVETSFQLDMTAESLFKDLFSPDFKKTPSYHYFKKVSHPNSLEYQVFVKENYLPKP